MCAQCTALHVACTQASQCDARPRHNQPQQCRHSPTPAITTSATTLRRVPVPLCAAGLRAPPTINITRHQPLSIAIHHRHTVPPPCIPIIAIHQYQHHHVSPMVMHYKPTIRFFLLKQMTIFSVAIYVFKLMWR